MAPVVIRHGKVVAHVNDINSLSATLSALREFGVGDGRMETVDASLPAVQSTSNLSRSILELSSELLDILANSQNKHFSSLRHAIVASRSSLPKDMVKRLEHVNSCAFFLRHYSMQFGKDIMKNLSDILADGVAKHNVGFGVEEVSSDLDSIPADDLFSNDEFDPWFGKKLGGRNALKDFPERQSANDLWANYRHSSEISLHKNLVTTTNDSASHIIWISSLR